MKSNVTLVADHEDIIRNIREFSSALNGGITDRNYAARLVSKGHVYYPFVHNGVAGFAPSKFIGYPDNTIGRYRKSTKPRSGSKTTARITSILRLKPCVDARAEADLQRFCEALGVELAAYKHSFWQLPPVDVGTDAQSAIDDLADARTGNDDPEYRRLMTGYYKRDDKVRRQVRTRAAGKCEYCGKTAFEGTKGGGFVECHHVVALSARGIDRPENVIGLCPNHHREAHLGTNWKALNLKFLEILEGRSI